MSDLEEFLELTKKEEKVPAPELTESPPAYRKSEVFDFFEDPVQQQQENVFCQYSQNGAGFIPTSKTFKKLGAGIYRLQHINDMLSFVKHNIPTDTLLRLPDSKSDEVLAEIEKFWSLKEKFKKHGFSHKRGILLWGPPGGGKTSTINLLMNQMVKSGGVVFLGDVPPDWLIYSLPKFRQVEPDRQAIVVLEDLDTLIRKHGESQVLSLLDGEHSINNVVYIATTNYPENLDGRIANRPSRFDKVIKIDMPNADARKMYLESRNLDLSEKELNRWVIETDGFSIAHLKELIISVVCLGNDFNQEVKRLSEMGKTPSSEDDNKKTVGFGMK